MRVEAVLPAILIWKKFWLLLYYSAVYILSCGACEALYFRYGIEGYFERSGRSSGMFAIESIRITFVGTYNSHLEMNYLMIRGKNEGWYSSNIICERERRTSYSIRALFRTYNTKRATWIVIISRFRWNTHQNLLPPDHHYLVVLACREAEKCLLWESLPSCLRHFIISKGVF